MPQSLGLQGSLTQEFRVGAQGSVGLLGFRVFAVLGFKVLGATGVDFVV